MTFLVSTGRLFFVNGVKRDYIEVWDEFRRARASLFRVSRRSHASLGGLSYFRVN